MPIDYEVSTGFQTIELSRVAQSYFLLTKSVAETAFR